MKLKGFDPHPERLARLLGGIALASRVKRSLDFLLREGFLRRTLDGKVVMNQDLEVTTDEIPNAKIRAFHKKSLDIARRNLDLYPITKRRESALIMHLNQASIEELKELLKDFYERLIAFAEAHPDDNEELYQVLINLTPIGG